MRSRPWVALLVMIAFALALVAAQCGEVEKKRVKLSDIDKSLKKYEKTQWDALTKKKVNYVVAGNKKVDEFALQSALTFGAFVQARFVSNKVGKDLKQLKKSKNKKAIDEARDHVKIAQKILETAIANAPEIYKSGQALVSNPSSLVSNPTQIQQVVKSLQQALDNLMKVTEEGPALVKDLVKLTQDLAAL